MSVAWVDGGRVEGCWRAGVEGMLMRRWVERASGRARSPVRSEERIFVDVWPWEFEGLDS